MRTHFTTLLVLAAIAVNAQQMHNHKDENMAKKIVDKLKVVAQTKSVEEAAMIMGKDTLLYFKGVPYDVSPQNIDNAYVFRIIQSPKATTIRKFGEEGELTNIIVKRADGARENINYVNRNSKKYFSRHNTPLLFKSEIYHPNGTVEKNDVSEKGRRINIRTTKGGLKTVTRTDYLEMGKHIHNLQATTKGSDTIYCQRKEDGRIVYLLNDIGKDQRWYKEFEEARRIMSFKGEKTSYHLSYKRFNKDSVIIRLMQRGGDQVLHRAWYGGHSKISEAMNTTSTDFTYFEMSNDGGTNTSKFWLDKDRKFVKEERFEAGVLKYMCAVMKTNGKPTSVIVEENGKTKTYKYDQAVSKGICVFKDYEKRKTIVPKVVFEPQQGPPDFKYNSRVDITLQPELDPFLQIETGDIVGIKGSEVWNGNTLAKAIHDKIVATVPNLIDKHLKTTILLPINKDGLGEPELKLNGMPMEQSAEGKKILDQYMAAVKSMKLKSIKLPGTPVINYKVDGKWNKTDVKYQYLRVDIIFPVEVLN